MRRWILRGAVAAIAVALVLLVWPQPQAISQIPAEVYLSLEGSGTGSGAPGIWKVGQAAVPPNCSTWHELYPAFCVNHHQSGYDDNGGSVPGSIDVCDNIELDGVTWHIKWVGPTYYMTCFPASGPQEPVIYEPNPDAPHDPANPVCEMWVEINPNFGDEMHIDEWVDTDGSQTLTPCDEIFSNGVLYHIDDIQVNIIIEPGGTPVDPSTWGKIKNTFRSLFD